MAAVASRHVITTSSRRQDELIWVVPLPACQIKRGRRQMGSGQTVGDSRLSAVQVSTRVVSEAVCYWTTVPGTPEKAVRVKNVPKRKFSSSFSLLEITVSVSFATSSPSQVWDCFTSVVVMFSLFLIETITVLTMYGAVSWRISWPPEL